jgi:hypothetical protein
MQISYASASTVTPVKHQLRSTQMVTHFSTLPNQKQKSNIYQITLQEQPVHSQSTASRQPQA